MDITSISAEVASDAQILQWTRLAHCEFYLGTSTLNRDGVSRNIFHKSAQYLQRRSSSTIIVRCSNRSPSTSSSHILLFQLLHLIKKWTLFGWVPFTSPAHSVTHVIWLACRIRDGLGGRFSFFWWKQSFLQHKATLTDMPIPDAVLQHTSHHVGYPWIFIFTPID